MYREELYEFGNTNDILQKVLSKKHFSDGLTGSINFRDLDA